MSIESMNKILDSYENKRIIDTFKDINIQDAFIYYRYDSFFELINELVPIYPWIFKTYIDCKCRVNQSQSRFIGFFICPYLSNKYQCIDSYAREDMAIQYAIFYLKFHKCIKLEYIEDNLPDPTYAPHICDGLRIDEWTMVMSISCEILNAVKIIQRSWRKNKANY